MSADVIPIKRKSRFHFEPYAEIKPRPASWLVKGALPASGVAYIAGPSKAGKSFLALDIATKIASGGRALDRRTLAGGVVYVAAEDADGVRLRIEAIRRSTGIEDAALEMVGQAPNLLDPDDFADLRVSVMEAAERLSELGYPLRAVFIDTLSQSIPGGEENSSPDLSKALFALRELSERLSALVVVVAHTGKDESRGIRGWSGQTGNADAIILVSRDDETNARTVTLDKVKNGVDGVKIGFSLSVVELGEDRDGDPITSCVIDLGDVLTASNSVLTRLSGGAAMARDALAYLVDQNLTVASPALPGIKAGTPAVPMQAWKDRAGEIGLWDEDDTPTNRRQKWHTAKTKVRDAGLVRIEGDYAIPLGALGALGGVRP